MKTSLPYVFEKTHGKECLCRALFGNARQSNSFVMRFLARRTANSTGWPNFLARRTANSTGWPNFAGPTSPAGPIKKMF
jgi:hypothetical protein